jgi:hypothetical protein
MAYNPIGVETKTVTIANSNGIESRVAIANYCRPYRPYSSHKSFQSALVVTIGEKIARKLCFEVGDSVLVEEGSLRDLNKIRISRANSHTMGCYTLFPYNALYPEGDLKFTFSSNQLAHHYVPYKKHSIAPVYAHIRKNHLLIHLPSWITRYDASAIAA